MAVAERPRRRLRFHPFELDTLSGELRKHGRKVRLQDKPMRLLELLLEHPSDVVTREEVRQRLWSGDTFVDFDAGLNTAVSKLRTALGDSAEKPQFVETLGRRGYRFIAALEPAAEDSQLAPGPRAEPPTPELRPVATAPEPTARSRRRYLVFASILLLLLAWVGLRSEDPARQPIRSLAVLPLVNLSGDPQQDYFVDGMTDALITDLASIRSLRVISRQSVMRFKGSRDPMPEIGRQLDVDAIIEGTVVRSGGRVRVTAQLVLAATDRHVWARSYERELRDVLGLQGELAGAIAAEVRARLTPEEHARLSAPRPVDPAAYDAYLRGRFFWNLRDEASLKKAVAYFEDAIAADPAFALAHAGLAEAYGPLGFRGFLPPSESTPRMKTAALKAVELDPELAEGHTALAACLSFHEWKWSEAEKEFRRAIDLDSRYGTAHAWYGLHLMATGRVEEALRERLLALENDPLSLSINWAVASSLAATGQTGAAIARYRTALELDPRYYQARVGLAELYALEGRHEEALAELGQADASSGGAISTRAALAAAYAKSGGKGEALEIVAELAALSKTRYVSSVDMAHAYAGLGDTDRAFEWLERAYAERAPALCQIKVAPAFESLRSDRRFQDLLRRMNLT